jgi:hypothetical protein
MAKAETKLKVKTEETASEQQGTLKARRPLQIVRRGIDRFLEDFQLDFLRSRRSIFDVEPVWQHDRTRGQVPQSTSSRRTRPTRSRSICRGLGSKTSK